MRLSPQPHTLYDMEKDLIKELEKKFEACMHKVLDEVTIETLVKAELPAIARRIIQRRLPEIILNKGDTTAPGGATVIHIHTAVPPSPLDKITVIDGEVKRLE